MPTESFTKEFVLNEEDSKLFLEWLDRPNKKKFIVDKTVQYEEVRDEDIPKFLRGHHHSRD